MSFTTGSLFHQESITVAELFLKLQDWRAVREAVLADNLLQFKTVNTQKRVYREITSRLKTLCVSEALPMENRALKLLVQGTVQEQKQILWLAVCRRYRFIAEFARDVLRERYLNFQRVIAHEDFDIFFNHKADWHDELDRIANATRVKARQILFKMLKEADFLAFDNVINPTLLSARLIEVIASQRKDDILFFPVSPVDVRLARSRLTDRYVGA
ncbi:DUF1819 family protein [cf. Phormidesmis sp. LEGE 11477]|uniref:DUF1819 family protein n=1 Tax=cf. Phormidesmis sp. LEGE 11477 TaxID=1828680 RepID=UPI001D14F3C2|nr:DUF1819 family protein [cf. Phormidesmis sp. LEGE 11477]